jgi:hypothetical protein
MPRGFEGELCVYCGARPSTRTGDHVFARAFFLEDRRANLPKVPACPQCNGGKARVEHYLATVLPFGGRHPDAIANLQEQVSERLAQNARLHRELTDGRESVEIDDDEDGQQKTGTTTIPLDGEQVLRYGDFVVRGLLWHHWRIILKPGFKVRVMTPTNAIVDQFVSTMRQNPCRHVKGDLGSGTITYEGAQGNDYPEMSVWAISLYGAIVLSDHSHDPQQQASLLYAVTAKDEFFERPALIALFGDRGWGLPNSGPVN